MHFGIEYFLVLARHTNAHKAVVGASARYKYSSFCQLHMSKSSTVSLACHLRFGYSSKLSLTSLRAGGREQKQTAWSKSSKPVFGVCGKGEGVCLRVNPGVLRGYFQQCLGEPNPGLLYAECVPCDPPP